jgi:radical SAM superfamily enzyme YgiQ (UPF0313 family)
VTQITGLLEDMWYNSNQYRERLKLALPHLTLVGGMSLSLLVSLKPYHTVLSPDRKTILSFDREGRMKVFVFDEKTYLRSLNSSVVKRWEQNGRKREWLNEEDTKKVFSQVGDIAQAILREADDEELINRLNGEILLWTPDRLVNEKKRFDNVYRPIPILPPDQYLSVVLQVTEGCSWNKCSFCSFYQNRPFKIKNPEIFLRHIHMVKEFMGKALSARNGIFLGDGNALCLSFSKLEPVFKLINLEFPGWDIYSFLDVYTGQNHSEKQWSQMHEWGLRRVYIGMETGSDSLLKLLNKPGSTKELMDLVRRLKKTFVAVSVIIMVGIGGKKYREEHRRDTLKALADLPWDEKDLIYLSPFIEQPGTGYVLQREEEKLIPLSEEETEEEIRLLAEELRMTGVKVGRYDIRDFIY